MSRTSIVRKAEWDSVHGNHQGQWQSHIKQAEHRTVSNLGQKTLELILAKREPSTQDIRRCPEKIGAYGKG